MRLVFQFRKVLFLQAIILFPIENYSFFLVKKTKPVLLKLFCILIFHRQNIELHLIH